MKLAIKACGRCGSQDLRFRTWWGPYTCAACRWRGVPLEFGDETSWRAFVAAVQPGPAASAASDPAPPPGPAG